MTGWFAKAVAGTAAGAVGLGIPDGFAIDLGGTKIAAARFEGGVKVAQLRRDTDGFASATALVEHMADMVEELGYRAGARLGVAVAGKVDAAGRWQAVNRATLSEVNDIALRNLLAARLGPAAVLNDAAAATLAEARAGSGKGLENFAFVTVSTGVGGGLILNGRLLRSADGLAGHFGFMASSFGSTLCGSGRHGTVESVASGRAIARAASEAGHEGLDARAVFGAAGDGQAWAERIVETSAAAVAELCADLRAALGLGGIAIGGSLGFAPGYLARVARHMAPLPPLFHCPLTLAETGPDGPMIGALFATKEG
ncbi:MAG: ROK family protein [Rhodobacteraceae bacterium]|nr:ROK family protein [Paracoccaceae bacterium]